LAHEVLFRDGNYRIK